VPHQQYLDQLVPLDHLVQLQQYLDQLDLPDLLVYKAFLDQQDPQDLLQVQLIKLFIKIPVIILPAAPTLRLMAPT
jgi:hypothetical protein